MRHRHTTPSTRALIATGLLSLACADREVETPVWPAEVDLGVVVHLGQHGFEILGIAAFEDGRSLGPPLSAFVGEARVDRIEILGWSKADLLARVPEIQPEAWWSFEVARWSSGCERQQAEPEGGWSLPVSALEPSVFELRDPDLGFESRESSAVAPFLALRVPPKHVDCRAPSFGPAVDLEAVVLPPGATLLGRAPNQPRDADLIYRQLIRIDADRILVQSYAGLFVFSRREAYGDMMRERIAAEELPARADGPPDGPGWSWSGIAVAHRNSEGVVERVFASASHGSRDPNRPRGGGVFEIEIGEEGFVRPIITSTSYERGPGPGAIASAEDGGFVAVGAEGTILRKAASEALVRVGVVDPRPWYREVLATPDPELRHAAGSETGHLVVGDFDGQFGDLENALLGEVATAVTGLAFVPGVSPRIAIGTYSSGMWQVERARRVQKLMFRMAEGASCTSVSDACGLVTLDRSELAEGQDGALVASAGRCEDIVAIDVVRRCAHRLDPQLDRVTTLELSHGLLTVANEPGRLLELPLAQ